ncbi:GroES-like protein [Lentinus tigrinus ALCF2SS1-7]|uniref:GroES-like protein n=1 Tax=Lentinus tigrinus ALCF2SS1-6 TaxID=1328759 RepID=A0A5C2RUX1_9APHY|nr:GroES-like protein [Lentinus tigrinus ALCF2SS1-6]RPD69964.1 GroES-like protein [Lentinus tigrinus ALCF2SS1-7]
MPLPTQQNVLYLLSNGGPLAVRKANVPSPGPDDILLKVEAAGLNPLDWKIQTEGLFTTEYPAVLGFDVAGVVETVGLNVNRLKAGDRVIVEGHFGYETRAFQQYVSTPADLVAKIPDTLSFDEAVTLPVSVTTAVAPLYNPNAASRSVHFTPPWEKGGLGKYAGKAAVVLGGTSAVGQAVIQFLNLSGFSPIIATASLRNTDFVKSFGATHVVDRSLPRATLIQTIKQLTEGPIELVYDAISVRETKELGYEIASPGGSLILVVPEHVDHYKMPSGKDVRIVEAMGMFIVPENMEFGAKFTVEFEKLLQDGVVKPGIPELLQGGLNAVQEGLDRIKANKVSGKKLVVHPQETL